MKIFISTFIFILGHVLPSLLACAAEPPTAPVFRIETGMHTQSIRAVSTDRAGSVMVTGGYDKTLRVWSLSDGRLLKVLRPPIGPGNEGLVYSVAMSHDGTLVACGGFTAFYGGKKEKPEEGFNIFIFSRSSGKLLMRIPGIPGVVSTLDFSPDGKLLAAGYPGGLRIFRLHDRAGHVSFETTVELSFENERIETARFHPGGTSLISLSDAGKIRKHSLTTSGGTAAGHRDAVVTGMKPRRLALSPDGTKIAIGFDSPGSLEVRDASDLSLMYHPQLGRHARSTYLAVAWSADSSTLYAAGGRTIDGRKAVLAFNGEQEPVVHKLPLADFINALATLPNGRFIAVSADPGIAVCTQSGTITMEKVAGQMTLAATKDKLRLSHDGLSAVMAMKTSKTMPTQTAKKFLFSLMDRDLTAVTPSAGNDGYASQRENHDNFRIEKAPEEIIVNGRTTKLSKGDSYQHHVIAPDGETALVATVFRVFAIERSGSIRWQISSPRTVSALAVSGDGRFAVVAHASGSINWYRMKDRIWLASLMLLHEGGRWLIWTPHGFYDASPGSEDMIGWHINSGKDREAQFFPASRFRSEKYKPGLLNSFFEDFDIEKLKRAAGVALPQQPQSKTQTPAAQQILDDDNIPDKGISSRLPPVVTILSPLDGGRFSSSSLTVSYDSSTASDSPVTAVRLLVDGRPHQEVSRGLKVHEKPKAAANKDSNPQSLSVNLPERNLELSIIAENRHGASVPATVSLVWDGARKHEEFVAKPKLYAVVVGVSHYAKKELSLKFAAKDASDFAKALANQNGGLYRDVSVRLLTDTSATRDEIMDALEWLQKETTSRDVAMVFIAGHGVNDPTGIYYYLPHNADPDRLKRTGVVFSDIRNTLSALAGKAVLFVDTCHSGNVMGSRRAMTDINTMINELSSAENGVVVFASSTGRQYSLEDEKWGNGAFTKALVEGISGKADMLGSGKITINMLDLYLSEKVKEITGGRQTPTTTKPQTIPDFPVAVRR